MKIRRMKAIAALSTVLLLSGCNWLYGLGEKMPVYDDESRCRDTFFCFGGEAEKSKVQDSRRAPTEQDGMSAPPMPADMASGMPDGAPYRVPDPYGAPVPPPPGMAYGAPSPMGGPAMPPMMPPPPPYGGTPVMTPPYGVPPQGGSYPLPAPGRTPGGNERLKPWEANPGWKETVEPSPYNELMNAMDQEN